MAAEPRPGSHATTVRECSLVLSCLGALPKTDGWRLCQRFKILRRPEVERDEGDDEVGSPQDWLPNLQRGIEFGFVDEASFLGAPLVHIGSTREDSVGPEPGSAPRAPRGPRQSHGTCAGSTLIGNIQSTNRVTAER